ncbi:hypothetical protein B0X71_16895 [Planococcus lenghuensis]|uniref:Uncharacterized protein n=1 Tax=Planococcus lenghuensis TaxID=2213202 RepID=A0A1Q2L415_9BACL|nr:hypothetical protein B0X71_16895 [Planococcus lenghuensis]
MYRNFTTGKLGINLNKTVSWLAAMHLMVRQIASYFGNCLITILMFNSLKAEPKGKRKKYNSKQQKWHMEIQTVKAV